jgi:hypothetical protein
VYKVIPITVIVYCEECTVARYYLEYLKNSGYLAKKIILLLDGQKPQKMAWLWQFVPKRIIAKLRRYKALKERSAGELKSFIDYVGGFFETKVDLMGYFAFDEYSEEMQTEVINGFYDERLRLILEEQENKLFLYTCGGLVRKCLIEITNAQFIHIHPGLVPAFKGSDCFWWSLLLNGKAGASCFYMNAGIDTGDLILAKEYGLPKMFLADKFSNEVIYKGALMAVDPHVRARLLLDVIVKYEDQIGHVSALAQSPLAGDYYFHMHAKLKNKVINSVWKSN